MCGGQKEVSSFLSLYCSLLLLFLVHQPRYTHSSPQSPIFILIYQTTYSYHPISSPPSVSYPSTHTYIQTKEEKSHVPNATYRRRIPRRSPLPNSIPLLVPRPHAPRRRSAPLSETPRGPSRSRYPRCSVYQTPLVRYHGPGVCSQEYGFRGRDGEERAGVDVGTSSDCDEEGFFEELPRPPGIHPGPDPHLALLDVPQQRRNHAHRPAGLQAPREEARVTSRVYPHERLARIRRGSFHRGGDGDGDRE